MEDVCEVHVAETPRVQDAVDGDLGAAHRAAAAVDVPQQRE